VLSVADLANSAIAVPYNFMCGFSGIKARLAEEGRAVRFESIAPSAAGHADFLETGGIVLVSKTSDLPDLIPGIRLIPIMKSEGISIPVSLLLPEADSTHTPLPVLVRYLVDASDMLADRLR
jgi:hypothetical protein